MDSDTDIRNHVRTRIDAGKVVVEVEVISWPLPYRPESQWVKAAELSIEATPDEVDKSITRELTDRKYFRVCKDCGKKGPVGHMLEDDICHRCAETKHGVVF